MKHDHDFAYDDDDDDEIDGLIGPIPDEMFSLETGKPFRTCVECGRELFSGNVPYVIQKSYSGTEPIFELAICLPCATEFQKEISEESRDAIEAAFQSKLDLSKRFQLLISAERPDFQVWTSKCALCERTVEDCEGRSVACQCQGDEVLYLQHPFMVCSQCEHSINEVLSKKTRDAWDRFVGENMDCPPGIGEPVPETFPVLF